jgi:hypothetical protein
MTFSGAIKNSGIRKVKAKIHLVVENSAVLFRDVNFKIMILLLVFKK